MLDKLQQIGFSLNKANIYTTLTELGKTTAGPIIKKTGLHRSVVYTELDKLEAENLINKITVNGVANYQITNPEKILDDLENKQKIAQELLLEVKETIKPDKFEILVHQGQKAAQDCHINHLKKLPENSVTYVAGVSNLWWEMIGDKYDEYDQIRQSKKILWKNIAFSKQALELAKKIYLLEIRLIDKNLFPISSFNVGGDTILLQKLNDPITIIEIRNPEMAATYINYFEIMWKSAIVLD